MVNYRIAVHRMENVCECVTMGYWEYAIVRKASFYCPIIIGSIDDSQVHFFQQKAINCLKLDRDAKSERVCGSATAAG